MTDSLTAKDMRVILEKTDKKENTNEKAKDSPIADRSLQYA